jgi:hypothetical protein
MEHTIDFCRFRMAFNRLQREQKDKLLQKYSIGHINDFYSLCEKNRETIIIEANTQLYNNLVSRIRNYSGYELCLLYNYMENVKN